MEKCARAAASETFSDVEADHGNDLYILSSR